MSEKQGFRTFIRVLRNRNFFWLWLSQLISIIGDFFNFLAVPYLITVLVDGSEAASGAVELSAEAKALVGIATLAFTMPRLLGLFTGVFVDRWNRHRTMVTANIIAGLVVLLPLAAYSQADVWLLVLMQFLLALTTRFIQPTQSAIIPQIVDEEDLMAANGLFTMTMTIGFIVGPLLSGVMIETLGIKVAFIMDSLSFLVAAGILAVMVRVPKLEKRPEGEGFKAIMGNIWEGIRFVFVTPLLLASVISFGLMHGGLGGINAMWVPFMRETFGAGPIAITTVDAAQGLGMALGAVLLGFMIARMSKLAIGTTGLIVIGIALAGIGLAPALWVVIAVCFVLGMVLVPFESAISTLMQLATPKEMQGRVFSSFGAMTQASGVLMVGVVTALVASIPLRAIYVGGGIVGVLSGILWYVLVHKEVRRMEQEKVPTQPLETVPAAGD